MKKITVPTNIQNVILSAAENRKIIEVNLAEAAIYDFKSARQLKKGHYEKAAYYAILAQQYIAIASEAKRDDIKLHALHN